MTRRQTTFVPEGLSLVPEGLTREDLRLRKVLEEIKVLCPYCLYYGTLWDFSTLLKKRRGKHLISMAKCRCPDCGEGYTKRTLLKVAEMEMEEFGYWFWDRMFGKWSSHDRVSWEKFKQRLKAHFTYEDRQPFWDVYWEFKDAKSKDQVIDDRGAFEAYERMYGPGGQKDMDEGDRTDRIGEEPSLRAAPPGKPSSMLKALRAASGLTLSEAASRLDMEEMEAKKILFLLKREGLAFSPRIDFWRAV